MAARASLADQHLDTVAAAGVTGTSANGTRGEPPDDTGPESDDAPAEVRS